LATDVRVVLVGAGKMGHHHARALAAVGAEVAAVVDARPEAADAVAQIVGAPAYSDLSQVTDADFAIIAVPTSAHLRLAKQALAQGLHVLVEKPVAASVQDGQAILAAAKEKGLHVAVGHVERFNPCVEAMFQAIQDAAGPTRLHARRLSPRPERIQDVGCILDVGIHDIDIALALAGRMPRTVQTTGHHANPQGPEDEATMLLDFGAGLEARLEVSWRSPTRVRTWQVDTAGGQVKADLLARTGEVTVAGRTKPLAVASQDALQTQFLHFRQAILEGHPPRVDGSAGLRALIVAEAALRSLAQGGALQTVAPQPEL
jgi:UDP-N-acetylglucosamine 3-dehydrogenase